MEYHGLQPIKLNDPSIELETPDGRWIDLYNDAALRAIAFDASGLTFEFEHGEYSTVLVRFLEVRNLTVRQPPDWVRDEFPDIDHLLVRPPGPYELVVFKAGGLEYEFDCVAIALVLSD
jgi:hypothetical protein